MENYFLIENGKIVKNLSSDEVHKLYLEFCKDKDGDFIPNDFYKHYIHINDLDTRDKALPFMDMYDEFIGEKDSLMLITKTNIRGVEECSLHVKPKIGDKVSYAFNGDCTPCGEIEKISPTMKKITTTRGQVFYNKKGTASWVMYGTWSMVKGHYETRNPHI